MGALCWLVANSGAKSARGSKGKEDQVTGINSTPDEQGIDPKCTDTKSLFSRDLHHQSKLKPK